MKTKTTAVRCVAGCAAIGLFLLPSVAGAASFRTGQDVQLGGSLPSDDFYLAGNSVTANTSIRGSLFAAGGSVLITGPVTADITAAGGSVTVTNTVGGSARLGGGTVIINSRVGTDVLAAGGQVHVSGAGIGRDAVLGGGVITLSAPVGGSVRAGGGEVYLDAPIAGGVKVNAKKLVLGPSANIQGPLTYTAEQKVTMEDGAVVHGAVTYTPRPAPQAPAAGVIAGILSMLFLVKLVALFIGALAIALIFKRYTRTVVHTALTSPLRELGRGFVFLVAVPVAAGILLVTVVGMPLGILGLLAYGVVCLTAGLLMPVLLGSLVYRWFSKSSEYTISWLTILIGVVLYLFLVFIPFIGWLIDFGFFLLALGALVRTEAGILKEWR